MILTNATIYTVDSAFSKAEAFAVKDGKFIAVGTSKEINTKYTADQNIDGKGKIIYPGFIDAHCHFYRFGTNLQSVDLVGTRSYDEVLKRVTAFQKENQRTLSTAAVGIRMTGRIKTFLQKGNWILFFLIFQWYCNG